MAKKKTSQPPPPLPPKPVLKEVIAKGQTYTADEWKGIEGTLTLTPSELREVVFVMDNGERFRPNRFDEPNPTIDITDGIITL